MLITVYTECCKNLDTQNLTDSVVVSTVIACCCLVSKQGYIVPIRNVKM